MKKQILLLTAMAALSATAMAQAPGYAWAKMTGSVASNPGVTNIGGIATDTVNHFVYVAGSFSNGDIDFGTGDMSSETGINTICLAKYDLGGNIIWAKVFPCSHDCNASGLAVDGSGNLFMTGYSEADTLRLGTHYLYNSAPNSTDHSVGFLAKFDGAGNCLWAKGNTGGGGMQASAVAMDNSGNAYITGFSVDDASMFEGHSVIGGAFFAKFNTAGTLQWFTQGGPDEPFVSQGNDIAVDHSGNVVVAGAYSDSIYFGSYGVGAYSSGLYDRFVVKMNGATGSFLWAKGEGIWQSPDYNFGIATDASDNIYMTGFTGIATEGPGSSANEVVNFLEKLNASGTLQWINEYPSPYYTQTMSLTADAAGNTCFLMTLTDTTTFGAYTITPYLPFGQGTFSELAVVKTNSSGTVLYARADAIPAGSFTIQQGFGIALDGPGNVYYAGILEGATDCDATHLDAGSGMQMQIAKLGTTVAGINEPNGNAPQYGIYPNPATDMFYIGHIDGKTMMQITDISGKTVQSAQLSNTTESIDVSALSKGIYFISLTTEVSHVTQKLVITH